MAEKKITEEKVYLMVTITTDNVRAFNEWWTKESLPYWKKLGAKHIGSWVNWIGGPLFADDEIIRIFEFENLEHYGRWEDWLHGPEARELVKKIGSFKIKSQRRLLHSAPTE